MPLRSRLVCLAAVHQLRRNAYSEQASRSIKAGARRGCWCSLVWLVWSTGRSRSVVSFWVARPSSEFRAWSRLRCRPRSLSSPGNEPSTAARAMSWALQPRRSRWQSAANRASLGVAYTLVSKAPVRRMLRYGSRAGRAAARSGTAERRLGVVRGALDAPEWGRSAPKRSQAALEPGMNTAAVASASSVTSLW